MSIISAKYPGTCGECHRPIVPGQRIRWAKGESSRHEDCQAASRAPVTPATTCPTCGGPKKAEYRTCYRCSGAAKKCRSCGHVERRNARGYVDGDRVVNGECTSCREERQMGY